MLSFRPLTIEDKELFESRSYTMGEGSCDMAFANIFCWSHLYNPEIAEWESFIFIRFCSLETKLHTYMQPIGEGDIVAAFNKIVEVVSHLGESVKMAGLSANFTEKLRFSMPICEYYIYPKREQFDYIYNAEQLRTLSGKKLQPKRNHINTFKKLYNFKYEPLSSAHKHEVLLLLEEWSRDKGNADLEAYEAERRAIEKGMDNFDMLGLQGLALYVDGNLAAFTYGSAINENTFCVHIEKGSMRYERSFAMVNYLFVNTLPKEYCYINREEDLGISGLRDAKLSYQPLMLYPKFNLIEVANNEDKIEDIKRLSESAEIGMLWSEAFGDDAEFINCYLSQIRPLGKSYILRERGAVVATADLFNFKGEYGGCPYIYGVATHKNYRGRGYGKLIIKDVLECIYNHGGFRCMLIPANPDIAEWYAGMGFSNQSPLSIKLANDYEYDFGTGDKNRDIPQYRVVNAELYLSNYAKLHPDIEFCVRVEDNIILPNNALFKVGGGRVEKVADLVCDNLLNISQLFDKYPIRESFYSMTNITDV